MPACSGIRVGGSVVAAGMVLGIAMDGVAQAAMGQSLPAVRASASNQVPGCVTPSAMMKFVRRKNPHLGDRFRNVADLYAQHGQRLGVRWDIAFLQMMVETGNLTFDTRRGARTTVLPHDNNFAGLGAIGDGRSGELFRTKSDGVRAHLEHVLLYAGDTILSPMARRTARVQAWRVLDEWRAGFHRPITFSDVALKWTPGSRRYLERIERLAKSYQGLYCKGRPVLIDTPDLIAQVLNRPGTKVASAWKQTAPASTVKLASATPIEPPKPGNPRFSYLPSFLTEKPKQEPDFTSTRGALGATAVIDKMAEPEISSPVPPVPVTRPAYTPPRRAKTNTVAAKVAPAPPRQEVVRPPVITEDDRVRQMISDRQIVLHKSGAQIPVSFSSNGVMKGDANGYGFYLGASRDSGKWWVRNGKLCQKWRVWLERKTHCLRLTERAGLIHWRTDDGDTGTARIVRR